MAKEVNRVLKLRIFEIYTTQSEFAKQKGIDPTVLSRVINGYKTLSESKKQQWAKWLQSDPDEIWGNEKPKKKLLVRRR